MESHLPGTKEDIVNRVLRTRECARSTYSKIGSNQIDFRRELLLITLVQRAKIILGKDVAEKTKFIPIGG